MTALGTVVCFGEALCRLSTDPGSRQLSFANELALHIGGAEVNVAAALAGLGHDTKVITALPDNPLGDRALMHMRLFGINTSSVVRAGGRLGLYFVDTGASLRPSRVTYDRAASLFAVYDWTSVDWAKALGRASVLHVSGITLAVSTLARRAAFAAMRAARKLGVTVSFDGNFRPALWLGRERDVASVFAQALSLADLAFVDHRDAAMVLGKANEPSVDAKDLFAAFPQLRQIAHTRRRVESVEVQHLAARFVSRDGQDITTDPTRIGSVVDRIGSGDAFAAGILHAVLNGSSGEMIANCGLAAACLKHFQPGDALSVSAADLQDVWTSSDVRR